MLAARTAHPVSLAIALAASLSACNAATFADESPPAAPLQEPDSNADPAEHRGHQGTDVTGFVPDDTIVRMEKRGDLDGDGDQDVLLVLRSKGQAESAPRTLMILRGTTDGSFEKVMENRNAILCQSCGGMMEDPLSDIEIHSDGFTVTFEGGSRELWSRTYSFAYSETEDDWHLDRIDGKMLDRIDGNQDESHATREQIGAISIRDFDAALMARDPGT